MTSPSSFTLKHDLFEAKPPNVLVIDIPPQRHQVVSRQFAYQPLYPDLSTRQYSTCLKGVPNCSKLDQSITSIHEEKMKQSILIAALTVVLAGSLYFNFSEQAKAQSPTALAMTGDRHATWIVTDTNELIYCWWVEFPPRRDIRTNCRVMDKWRVDKI